MLLVAGLILTAATLYALRGGLTGQTRMAIVGMDAEHLGMAGLAFGAAAYFWGPSIGVAIVLAVIIHEFGHVAAFRVAGHADARFRLIPLMGGVAISDQIPSSQMKSFFITLMGPGISVAPMILAFGLAEASYDYFYQAPEFFYTLGSVIATLNFFNLLPFWPLDGGKCLRIIAFRINPTLAHGITLLMSAALAAAAVAMQSMILFFFALMGAQSIFQADALARVQHRLSKSQAIWAACAYLFTTAAHLSGGLYLILTFI